MSEIADQDRQKVLDILESKVLQLENRSAIIKPDEF